MSMRWMLLLCCLLAGCVSTGNANIADPKKVNQIKVGTTTKTEVLQLFGPPGSTLKGIGEDKTKEFEIWNYIYISHESNPISFVPLVGTAMYLSGERGTHKSNNLAVTFDQQGIVRGVGYGQGGASVTP